MYSFARSDIAYALSVRGSISGVNGSFYVDELFVILQVRLC